MNISLDLLRKELHEAAEVVPPPTFAVAALAKRIVRRRRARNLGVIGGATLAMTAIAVVTVGFNADPRTPATMPATYSTVPSSVAASTPSCAHGDKTCLAVSHDRVTIGDCAAGGGQPPQKEAWERASKQIVDAIPALWAHGVNIDKVLWRRSDAKFMVPIAEAEIPAAKAELESRLSTEFVNTWLRFGSC